MELGERLRQARLEAGLSQRQLCGEEITRNMLSQIENGAARPSMDTLRYLAGQLGKPISYFLEENAVLSGNQSIMEQARCAFRNDAYADALAILGDYGAPDPVFDDEASLVKYLSLLALAEEAIRENRLPYASQLLARAEVTGNATPYVTEELKRKALLLLARVQPRMKLQLLAQLSDEELLLRAEAALESKDFRLCQALLTAANNHSSRWSYLMGEAAFGLENYPEAARAYQQAEADLPNLVIPRLEKCYLQMGDYKRAYEYACKQRP